MTAPVKASQLQKCVYLAGPLFTMPDLWLLSEAKRCLEDQGLRVFSPKDDVGFVGFDRNAKSIADADIEGLIKCDLVFAILDGLDAGTLFEVGYARSRDMPVIGFAQRVNPADLTMLVGTGCEVYSEFATAVYKAGWKARRL